MIRRVDKKLVNEKQIVKRFYKMIKKLSSSNNNISGSVEFLLRGAMKRRVNALSCAKSVNSDMGTGKMIAAVK